MKANKQFSYRYTENYREKIYVDSRIDAGKPLPNTPYLSVMVWNIFKQQRIGWLSTLNEYGKGKQLVLLQEAQSTKSLIDFATTNYLVADQVPAIKMPNMASGVMTLSATYPVYCKPFRIAEPLLRLPKSALVTVYPTYNAKLLMVVNVHAVNFSLGVEIYHEQIHVIAEHVIHHRGPVIFAGDFNTWSRQRLYLLYQFIRKMGLRAVSFSNDQRKNVFNHPLDFIFYRGLHLHASEVIQTDASDHNPLLVSFEIK